ncbi:MAG: hypothetical protein KF836_05785 [Fimbriimonadaceae bacterium]|nr:hypothetical protein [Fimbriimonadaceae bacterium]
MQTWLKEQVRIYRGNAASIKEYRIQLRSTKTIWYWGIYLSILVIVAMANYGSIVSSASNSPSSLQSSLQTYYQIVVGFLQGMILLIAPMLGASAIVSEYDLRSIELVFSSPASTKYLLVGKYLAALRQLALLLFLSLPITAVGVTLGGATWQQVIEQYLYLMMHGAIVLAVAMPIAINTQSMVRTISGVVAVLILGGFFAGVASASSMPMMFGAMGGSSTSIPPLVGLVPFLTPFTLGYSTPIGSVVIPNWIFAGIATLAIVKVLLLGAGSALTKVGSRETRSLRVHGLILVALYCFSVYATINSIPWSSAPQRQGIAMMAVNMPLIPIFFILMFLAASGRAEDRKFLADKLFSWKEILGGRPSGSLGYGIILIAMVAFTNALTLYSVSFIRKLEILMLPAWGLAFGLMILGIGWWVSPGFDQVVGSRRTVVAVVMGLVILSHVGLMFLDIGMNQVVTEFLVLANPFIPWADSLLVVVMKTAILLTIAGLAYYFGEKKRRLMFNKYYGQTKPIEAAT